MRSGRGAPPWRHTLRYINRFGVRAGLEAARVRASSTEPVALNLPVLAHPLWVRPGTSDVETFDEVFMAREYQLPFDDFFPRRILDLGANVGYASVQFATRWPDAVVLAVEPSADNMVLLKRNTGPYPRVTALHGAVWSHATHVRIANPADSANAFQVAENVAPTTDGIAAYTVRQLIDQLGGTRADLVKMDVEGAEREILRDAAAWLDDVDVLVVELHDRIVPGCGEALCRALQGRHFRQEILGQNLVFDFRPESR